MLTVNCSQRTHYVAFYHGAAEIARVCTFSESMYMATDICIVLCTIYVFFCDVNICHNYIEYICVERACSDWIKTPELMLIISVCGWLVS